MIKVRRAIIQDLELLVKLFDGYRVFYNQSSDTVAARSFLEERILNTESIIFVAEENGTLIGFTQLYPTFSSVSLEKYYILNDLYVLPELRGKGVGKKILNFCQQWTIKNGYKGLSLETAVDNPAQKLYEREGWSKDDGFYHYFWTKPK